MQKDEIENMPHEPIYLDRIEERRKVLYETIELRGYQKRILDEVEATLAFDDLCVVGASMGAGKSVIISELCRRFKEEGKSVAVLTNIGALVPQIAKHLDMMNIDYNVVKAGMHDWEPTRDIHLIMEQSFHAQKREDLNLKTDILIKDEWHIGVNQKRYEDIKAALVPDAVVGLTATPIDERGYLLCGQDQIVMRGTTAELIDEGYLAKPKYYIPKWAQKMDYSKVRLSGNDYSEPALREIIDTPEFTKMALDAWEQMDGHNKQSAFYCVGIEHAENIYKALEERGYECNIVHSKRPQKENASAIGSFKNGETKILVSVSSLLIGFDAPNMNLLVNLRPTRLLRLWRQLGGRVLRTSPGKEYGEILDLGQCVSSLGFLEEPLPLIPKGDRRTLLKEMEKLSKPIVDTMVEDKPTYISRELVLEKIEELERKAKDYRTQPTETLMELFDTESDFRKLSLYALEIGRRIHGHQYKESTASWIAEPWNQAVEDHPDKEALLRKSFKSMTKGKLKRGSKVAGMWYSAKWLMKESDIAWMFGESIPV